MTDSRVSAPGQCAGFEFCFKWLWGAAREAPASDRTHASLKSVAIFAQAPLWNPARQMNPGGCTPSTCVGSGSAAPHQRHAQCRATRFVLHLPIVVLHISGLCTVKQRRHENKSLRRLRMAIEFYASLARSAASAASTQERATLHATHGALCDRTCDDTMVSTCHARTVSRAGAGAADCLCATHCLALVATCLCPGTRKYPPACTCLHVSAGFACGVVCRVRTRLQVKS